jgi:hypothetical protein
MTADQQPFPPIRLLSSQPIPVTGGNGVDLRSERVREFLQASNLAPNTQKAYRIELERFIGWSNKAWINVTPRDLAQFKHYLKHQCQTGASGGWGRLSMVSENRRGYRKGAPPKVHLQ